MFVKFLVLLMFLFEIKADFVEISTNGSLILGTKCFTFGSGKPYAAFWKIPYAKPPTGALRFKAPVPLQSVFKFTTHEYTEEYHETCSSTDQEDCLYLSIFTPLDQNEVYPVMVWLHEYSNEHDPDPFIEENVAIVRISYRTGIFGFLNTGDEFAPGNAGAKDIVTALKWIRDNIVYFKCDPNRVTVFGSGTAANIVASLILSEKADDLFNKVIIQSGSALSSADYKNLEFEIANKLYWRLTGLDDKMNRSVLYNELMDASTRKLSRVSQLLFDSTEVRDSQRLINSFGLTVESLKPNAFMSKNPADVYESGEINKSVKVLIGYNNYESISKLLGLNRNRMLLSFLNYNFQYVLPFEGRADEYESPRYTKIRQKIMDFYFLNGTITERSFRRYAKYVSDQVTYTVIRQARLHAFIAGENVYLYRFSYNGSLSSCHESDLSIRGATTGDEICYLFKCKSFNDEYKPEIGFCKRLVGLWTNFAKHGDPTPGKPNKELGEIKWNPLNPNGPLTVMKLASTMKMINVPEEKRVKFWDDLRQEFFVDKPYHDEL